MFNGMYPAPLYSCMIQCFLHSDPAYEPLNHYLMSSLRFVEFLEIDMDRAWIQSSSHPFLMNRSDPDQFICIRIWSPKQWFYRVFFFFFFFTPHYSGSRWWRLAVGKEPVQSSWTGRRVCLSAIDSSTFSRHLLLTMLGFNPFARFCFFF